MSRAWRGAEGLGGPGMPWGTPLAGLWVFGCSEASIVLISTLCEEGVGIRIYHAIVVCA